jgi:dTDP-4-dehydrorhamnose reductase
MKIYIFGSNGMLGNYVKSYLSKQNVVYEMNLSKQYHVISLTRKDYDLSQITKESLEQFLLQKEIQPNDVVINCAGIIPQSLQKDNPGNKKLYYLVNTIFPNVLGNLCQQYKWKFIHITTDCVFSGKDGQYNEDSIHDETNDYGVSKSLGELCSGTIIRTSIIGEQKEKNYSLLEWVRSMSNETIKGYNNHYWNGVTCLELAKIISQIISQESYWKGVRHVYSPTPVSKYELLKMINVIYNLQCEVESFTTEKKVDKTITSKYPLIFKIKELQEQIVEMKNYHL